MNTGDRSNGDTCFLSLSLHQPLRVGNNRRDSQPHDDTHTHTCINECGNPLCISVQSQVISVLVHQKPTKQSRLNPYF